MIKEKKRLTIGLIHNQLEGPVESIIWRLAVEEAKHHDHNLIIYLGKQLDASHRYIKEENIIYNLIEESQIDGLLISAGLVTSYFTNDTLEFLSRYSHIPKVSISHEFDNIHSFIINNHEGMTKIVEHLIIDHKYRNIAMIKGPETNDEANIRFEAYCQVLKKHKIPLDDQIILEGNFLPESGEKGINDLHKSQKLDSIEALVCANDETAVSAINRLIELGYKVPEDIAVTGFDDNMGMDNLSPPLTTVRQPFEKMMKSSYETLIDLINQKESPMVHSTPA
ncbi:MAG: substrate-binding domain-containing protein, partial [Spirochaetaceae bacterium]|nr:substrate-binding domain-containing protein [Spirochaetaceae bacterium]